jgi:hypothetical protein
MFRSVLLISLFLFGSLARAEDPVFTTEAGAIRGYDPVAYHLEGKPVPGKPDIVFVWQDAEWHFSNTANRDAFAAKPDKYAPRYGGFCAFGTSRGYKVSTQPEAFTIVDGALYLNYNLAVQETWDKDRPGYIEKADANWVTLKDDAYEPE